MPQPTRDLAGFLQIFDLRVGDEEGYLTDGANDREQFVDDSIEQYSSDRPARYRVLVDGKGTDRVDLPLLDQAGGWNREFSCMIAVEYPIVTDGHPIYLDPNDFMVREILDSDQVIAPGYTFELGTENVGLIFTSPHVVKDYGGSTVTSVPRSDWTAFCKWGASRGCLAIAAKYASLEDSQLVEARFTASSQSKKYLDVSKRLEEDYRRHIRPADEDASPAFETVELDGTSIVDGADYLFHRGDLR